LYPRPGATPVTALTAIAVSIAALTVAATSTITTAVSAIAAVTGATSVAATITTTTAVSTVATGTATIPATAIATSTVTTARATSISAFCQNHVTFKLRILDIGTHRCLTPVAVARQQVRRDRAPGRKGHEQQP
jgi:hypothetical protein